MQKNGKNGIFWWALILFKNPPKSQAPIFQPHPQKGKALFQTVDKRTGLKISNQFEKLKLVEKFKPKLKFEPQQSYCNFKYINKKN